MNITMPQKQNDNNFIYGIRLIVFVFGCLVLIVGIKSCYVQFTRNLVSFDCNM